MPYTYDGRPYKRIGPTTSLMPSRISAALLSAAVPCNGGNRPAEGYSANDLDTEEMDRTVRGAIQSGRLESRSSDWFDAWIGSNCGSMGNC